MGERGVANHGSLYPPFPLQRAPVSTYTTQTENQGNTISAMFELIKELRMWFDNLKEKVNTLMGKTSTTVGAERTSDGGEMGVDETGTKKESRLVLSRDEAKGGNNSARRRESSAHSVKKEAHCKVRIREKVESEKHKFMRQGTDDITGVIEKCNNNDEIKEKIYRGWIELQAHMDGFVALMESSDRQNRQKQHGCK